MDLTVFNLPEHNKGNGQENRIHDERDISGICTDLGLVNVQISQSIRLGKKTEGKIRPLKIILTERAHRKFILDNAKYIPSKVRFEFRNVIFSKDLTPQQREERRKQIATKKGAKNTFQGGTSFVDLLCFCSVLCLLCFVRVCLYVLCGHLLGKG